MWPSLSDKGAAPASGAVQPQAAAHLPLVDDGVRVAVRDSVLIGKRVCAHLATQEGEAGFKTYEPLSKVTTCDAWYAGNQVFVRLQGANQRQLAPPGVWSLLL